MESEEAKGMAVSKDPGDSSVSVITVPWEPSTVGKPAMKDLESRFRHAQRRTERASWQRLSPQVC